MDIVKQVEYWTTGSEEDLAAAGSLLEKGHLRHGLFFAHWALEKLLKALVVQRTGQIPPKIHNLVRLAQRAGLKPDPQQERFLRRFDVHQMEGRYPDSQLADITSGLAQEELQKAVEMARWLKAQLSMR